MVQESVGTQGDTTASRAQLMRAPLRSSGFMSCKTKVHSLLLLAPMNSARLPSER